jgi:hypothetical protein
MVLSRLCYKLITELLSLKVFHSSFLEVFLANHMSLIYGNYESIEYSSLLVAEPFLEFFIRDIFLFVVVVAAVQHAGVKCKRHKSSEALRQLGGRVWIHAILEPAAVHAHREGGLRLHRRLPFVRALASRVPACGHLPLHHLLLEHTAESSWNARSSTPNSAHVHHLQETLLLERHLLLLEKLGVVLDFRLILWVRSGVTFLLRFVSLALGLALLGLL